MHGFLWFGYKHIAFPLSLQMQKSWGENKTLENGDQWRETNSLNLRTESESELTDFQFFKSEIGITDDRVIG